MLELFQKSKEKKNQNYFLGYYIANLYYIYIYKKQ